jgi:hypothetical protein
MKKQMTYFLKKFKNFDIKTTLNSLDYSEWESEVFEELSYVFGQKMIENEFQKICMLFWHTLKDGWTDWEQELKTRVELYINGHLLLTNPMNYDISQFWNFYPLHKLVFYNKLSTLQKIITWKL